jgi:hypothetical protein
VALPTVAMHLAHARKRLGAHTREDAVAMAVSLGLIEPQRSDTPQAIPIYLIVAESSYKPDEACAPGKPRLLDVEQRIFDGKLEFEVREVGFRFVLSFPNEIKAVLIRCCGIEVHVQAFYRHVNKNLHESASRATSGDRSCECWGTGCVCFPIE